MTTGLAARARGWLGGWLGDRTKRTLAAHRARAAAIGDLAGEFRGLSDDDLRARFASLRERRRNGAPAKALMNESFAATREAAERTLGMRHFDEQLMGGMILFDGGIAEMKTGEGKTLAATLPACLEALSGEGTHVVTVNDYLARRDAEWMGPLYRYMGLSAGANAPDLSATDKAAAHACDIVYGTNNEFGFDYLRHNMRHSAAGLLRRLNYAIIDEVDSILIDEARTPLIISGESDEDVGIHGKLAALAKKFSRGEGADGEGGDFALDEKARAIHLTEAGFERAERLFAEAGLMAAGASLYESTNLRLLHHLDAALRALHLFARDREYAVRDGQAVIVDEFTGRLMPGRRWGDGLHQAVEAKEGLEPQKENRALASISLQNYFRLYGRIAGMTGTALTEAGEFEFIYGLRVTPTPTHRRMIRRDELDKVYRTAAAKERAVLADIRETTGRGQPSLIGTTAIADSERLAALLAKEGLRCNVLNAKNHAGEAAIVAQAGAAAAITIATNMAGRGTDIILGGNPAAAKAAILADESLSAAEKERRVSAAEAEWRAARDKVVAAGGLRIIGTERHESRRIDNQLRGRAGRQGDPGSSAFYLSFEDSLLRVFATKHVSALMEKLKMPDDEAIEAKMVSRTIENAQRKVEAHNFDIRKQLLEYDDIANEQRRLIYEQREEVLGADDVAALAADFRGDNLEALFDEYFPADAPEEEWRAAELERLLATEYRVFSPLAEMVKTEDRQPREYFLARAKEEMERRFAEKFAGADEGRMREFLRSLILSVLDEHWRGHIAALDGLRQSIGLRGMAQKNPKQEYKREAFDMFAALLRTIQTTIARALCALVVRREEDAPPPPTSPLGPTSALGPAAGGAFPAPAAGRTKTRRNDPCPCGSGKKHKHCCGRI